MPTLSDQAIAAYARQAGWSGDDLVKAVAVALAESGGRTDVVNFLGCVGLWQVYQRVHARAHPLWTTAWLKNPANNAQAAHTIWVDAGNRWTPWTTYTSGSYKRYLPRARAAASGAGAALPGPLEEPIQAGTGIFALSIKAQMLLAKLRDPLFWRSVAFVIVGCILIIMALVAMSATPGKIRVAKKIIGAVTPEGRVASVVGKVTS
jgi:hypothetical protein